MPVRIRNALIGNWVNLLGMKGVLEEFRDIGEPKNVVLISSTHGVNEFFSIAIPPIIPFLVSDLEISFAEAGLLLTVFFVMYSIFQLPAGILGDRIGKKRLLVGGMLGMSAGIFLAGWAQSYSMLVVAQIITGISGSTYHPTGMSLISDFESQETEGKAMGIFGFCGMLGTALAPLIIGGIAGFIHWRVGLTVAAVMGVIVTVSFSFFFTQPTQSPNQDHGLMNAQSEKRSNEPRDTTGIASVRDSITEILKVPLTTGIILLLLLNLFVSIQTRAIMTFTTSYVFSSTGQTISLSNVVFFVMLAAGSMSALVTGSLADRVDRGKLGATASLVTATLLGMAFIIVGISGSLPSVVLFPVLIVLFFAIGGAMYANAPIKNALVSQHAQHEFSGSLFGVVQTVGALGSAIGPALFGFLATELTITAAYPMIAIISIFIGLTFYLVSRNIRSQIQPAATEQSTS